MSVAREGWVAEVAVHVRLSRPQSESHGRAVARVHAHGPRAHL